MNDTTDDSINMQISNFSHEKVVFRSRARSAIILAQNLYKCNVTFAAVGVGSGRERSVAFFFLTDNPL